MIASLIGEVKMRRKSTQAKIYHLTVAMPYTDYDENNEEVTRYTQYVRVSAAISPLTGPETYIFPSDHSGKVISWIELEGSLKGELNHNQALRNAGYWVRGSEIWL